MKSAWELALERTGGELSELTQEQKDQIAEIESIYKSKIVAAQLAAQEKIAKAQTPAEIEQIQNDLTVEKASFESKMEQEKEKIRNA